MSKLNVNAIIFENDIMSVDDSKYAEIKKRSRSKKYIFDKFKSENAYYIEKRAYELTNSSENKDLNKIEKYIYLSNLIFPNDESFSKILLKKGYEINKLKDINTLLKTLKTFNEEDRNKILDNELIDELNYFSKLYFGINNTSILVNKSNEIIVKNPKLLIRK